jgi:ferric-dicitrate binding protein FerR (iron transport regulator)
VKGGIYAREMGVCVAVSTKKPKVEPQVLLKADDAALVCGVELGRIRVLVDFRTSFRITREAGRLRVTFDAAAVDLEADEKSEHLRVLSKAWEDARVIEAGQSLELKIDGGQIVATRQARK